MDYYNPYNQYPVAPQAGYSPYQPPYGGAQPPQYYPPQSGGGMAFAPMSAPASPKQKVNIDFGKTDWSKVFDKMDPAKRDAALETLFNNINAQLAPQEQSWWDKNGYQVYNGVGLGLTALNMYFQYGFQSRAMDQYDQYQKDMKELNNNYITLQEKTAEIGYNMSVDRNTLVRELAEIQADFTKQKTKWEIEAGLEKTRILANNGYLNNKFYGNPDVETYRYI